MSQAGRSLSKRSKHILIFLLRFSPFKLKKKKNNLKVEGHFGGENPCAMRPKHLPAGGSSRLERTMGFSM